MGRNPDDDALGACADCEALIERDTVRCTACGYEPRKRHVVAGICTAAIGVALSVVLAKNYVLLTPLGPGVVAFGVRDLWKALSGEITAARTDDGSDAEFATDAGSQYAAQADNGW